MKKAVSERPSVLNRHLHIAVAFAAAVTVSALFMKPLEEGPGTLVGKVKICQVDGACTEKRFPLTKGTGRLDVGGAVSFGKTKVTLLECNGQHATMLVEFPMIAYNQFNSTVITTVALGAKQMSLGDSVFSTRIAARKPSDGSLDGKIEVSVWIPVLDGI